MRESHLELELKVRNGLFLAASRTYGEQYVEPFIRNQYDLIDPPGNDHDGVGKDGTRYEIKSSKVLKKTENISTKVVAMRCLGLAQRGRSPKNSLLYNIPALIEVILSKSYITNCYLRSRNFSMHTPALLKHEVIKSFNV